VLLRWDDHVRSEVGAALSAARSGQPEVVLVEGEAGVGKSSLLDHIAATASDFTELFAEGAESDSPHPWNILDQLGVRASDASLTPASAAQQLRELVDSRSGSGPLLVIVDDWQWADPESVDALIDLTARAAGDALLLAIGSRPLDSSHLPRWRRWASRPGRVRTIRLTGLSLANAIDLVREIRPGREAHRRQRGR
jgi:predicted ATPase